MAAIETIGPNEIAAMPFGLEAFDAPAVPWSDDVLAQHVETHLLIFAPAGITINNLRERFGMDPSVQEPCMYNQDWYIKEDFANAPTDGRWHLLRKSVLEDARAKRPEEIEATLLGETFPSAALCAFAFFAYWFHTNGKRLWNHDFVWCSDRDHNNDRIYVGRYEDPTGVNKNGFNIHRHLSLRPAYSAAPEIK